MANLIIRYGSSSEGQMLTDGQSMSIGSFVKDTVFTLYLFLTTDSQDTVYIASDSITVGQDGSFKQAWEADPSGDSDGWVLSDIVKPLPVSIFSGKPMFISIDVDTSSTGNKSISFQSITDASDPKFLYTFYFTVTEPSTQNPQINVIYDGNSVSQEGTVSLGRFAQESVSSVNFEIFNYAIPSLVIPQDGISITSIGSSETVTSNPSSSGEVSLSFNQNCTLTVELDTLETGDKSFVVVISSNDPDENPFIFTVTYSVSLPFELIVSQGDTDLDDGSTLNLGSYNERTTINKVITLENNGISYGIRVTNILVGGEVSLVNLPSLPFVLQPNNSNSVQFTLRFASSSLGRKTGDLSIQWEVEA